MMIKVEKSKDKDKILKKINWRIIALQSCGKIQSWSI